MKQQFNMDEAFKLVKQGAKIDGKDGVLAPLIKQFTEVVLEAEIESHLSRERLIIVKWKIFKDNKQSDLHYKYYRISS